MQEPYYNRYNTELSPEERQGLYEHLMNISMSEGRNRFNDMNDYDMAGAYLEEVANKLANGHFYDTYKKPNHPVFSDDSQYNGADGHYGGHWTGGTPDVPGGTFFPSEWNLRNLPPRRMIQYFQEREPNAHLYLPGDGVDTETVFYKGNNARGGNDNMIRDFTNKNSGGGLWDSIVPKVLGLGGMALGGPVGGLIGNFAGNVATGQDVGSAAVNTGMGAINKYGDSLWDNDSLWNKQMSNWRDRRSW